MHCCKCVVRHAGVVFWSGVHHLFWVAGRQGEDGTGSKGVFWGWGRKRKREGQAQDEDRDSGGGLCHVQTLLPVFKTLHRAHFCVTNLASVDLSRPIEAAGAQHGVRE